MIPVLDDIIKEARIAKKKGQKLENRLVAYYRAIYGLGFYRKGRD
jgi:hypothetical protein